jgi:hypothetical protein
MMLLTTQISKFVKAVVNSPKVGGPVGMTETSLEWKHSREYLKKLIQFKNDWFVLTDLSQLVIKW